MLNDIGPRAKEDYWGIFGAKARSYRFIFG